MQIQKKGFTLLELLIVIGILAILASATAVVLNPAELLRQARDTQRLSDLDSVKSAVALYLTDQSTVTLTAGPFITAGAGGAGTCGLTAGNCTLRAVYTVDGNGWAAANIGIVSTGSPLPILPRDPTNDATYNYSWAGDNTNKTFELNTRLESAKFKPMMTTDGGEDGDIAAECTTYLEMTCFYETGTDPGLNL